MTVKIVHFAEMKEWLSKVAKRSSKQLSGDLKVLCMADAPSLYATDRLGVEIVDVSFWAGMNATMTKQF